MSKLKVMTHNVLNYCDWKLLQETQAWTFAIENLLQETQALNVIQGCHYKTRVLLVQAQSQDGLWREWYKTYHKCKVKTCNTQDITDDTNGDLYYNLWEVG